MTEKTPSFTRSEEGITISCPGCTRLAGSNRQHFIRTKPALDKIHWALTEGDGRLTLWPSVLVRYPVGDTNQICHFFVDAGAIRYLSDCSHHLAGMTVPLMEVIAP